jgi:hypothetical protein
MHVNSRFLTRHNSLSPSSKPTPTNVQAKDNQDDDSFSPAEQRELDYWKDRQRFRLGTLATPPAGPRDEKMERARDYVVDILDRVAGKDLSERSDMEVRVEVFTGDVPQAALDDDMSREARWNRVNRDEQWPIRRWMETSDGNAKKPIYRLAVDLGMLKSLETEDQLAFVLAHQIEVLFSHDKEDPNNEERLRPATESFVDSREMQASADSAAIERMVKGGFNPRGAFYALSRLYDLNPIDYPEEDLERALRAAGHGHEAEGLRVGLAQADVENYIRKGDPTTSQEMKPIPDNVKIEARAHYDDPVADSEAFNADHRTLVEGLAVDETPSWMFNSYGPREHFRIQRAGGDKIDKEDALIEAAQHLDQLEGKTPQQKIDGFLRLILSLRHSALPRDENFSEDGLKTLHTFLSKYGSDWNPQTFVDGLTSKRNQSLHFGFVHSLVYNRNFQDMAGGSLKGLAEAVPMAWLKRNSDEADPELLASLVRKNHDEDKETWPMGPGIDKAMLAYLKTVDPTPLLAKDGSSGLSKATEMANELFTLKEPNEEFKKSLLEAGANLREKAGQSREQKARVRLQQPLEEPQKVNRFLEVFGKTESWQDFSPEFDQEFKTLLTDFVNVSTSQPGFSSHNREAKMYSHGIERRIVEIAKDSSDPKAGLKHLSRHLYATRRVRSHSPRRAWLGEAARLIASDYQSHIVNPDRSQHAQFMSDALTNTYLLTPEDLPDTSTASLRKLNERVQADEFEPKREDYQSDRDWRAARRRYSNARRDLRTTLEPLVSIESREVLSKIALLGHNTEISEPLTAEMTPQTFLSVLEGAEEAKERYTITKELYGSSGDEDVGADAGGFLVEGLVAVQDEIEGLQNWYDIMERTVDFGDGGLESRVEAERKLGDNLFGRLQGRPITELKSWLLKEKPLELMGPAHGSDILVDCLGEACEPGASIKDLAKLVEEFDERYKLKDEHPVTYIEFRDKVAEKAKLQPDTVDNVFPEEAKGVTDTNLVYRNNARSLSGLIALARERSPQEQINTIEYLMGRLDDMPPYLEDASEDQAFAPFRESLETTRQDLLESDNQTRVMIANSFLAGPSGVLRTEAGKEAVISHFLKDIKEENQELADTLARGVLYSHGDADTLAVAYIMGQVPEEPKEGEEKGKLGEAAILNRLFDAYGVPGIKMKQYLAFTSEFKDFKEAFEDAQDASMPLNYFQVLKLVQNRFGDEWPKDMKIDRVLGSGSVNVAIRYRNEGTGKREVVSLGRQDIEESTQYDFDRFNKLIGYMTQTPEDKEKYGYILGLLGLINDSVALEFQKEDAMSVQQHAYRTYRHEINGWEVRSIDAYSVKNLGLFMEEAKGKTARKTYQQDEDVYKEAMDAMAAAEFGVLRGVDSSHNWRPKPLFANPDFHDGQVMIDKDNKSVTILDFGQAVPITNEDRVGGLDLMTIIGKVDSAKNAAKRLNKRYFPDAQEPVITKELLEPILEREDRMDCFIHLLSTLSRNDAQVPISSVHWVLGMNRQIALAEKIGDPIDGAVRNMILNHKAGLSLSTFNASYDGWDGPDKGDGAKTPPAAETKPVEPTSFSLAVADPNQLLICR